MENNNLIPFQPEEIYNVNATQATRCKVPGGWLVNIAVSPRGTSCLTTTFVSDPEWKWSVE